MPNKTYVSLLLDRSGSMTSCRDAILGSVNKYIAETKGSSNTVDVHFALTIFDCESIDIIRNGSSADLKPLEDEEFVPRGLTPLLDAIAFAVGQLDEALANEPYAKAVFVVATDGEENASIKHTHAHVTKLIDDRQSAGWLIVFLGAGLDAARQGVHLGIRAGLVANISTERAHLEEALAGVRNFTSHVACGIDAGTLGLTGPQRQAMGDKSAGAGLLESADPGDPT